EQAVDVHVHVEAPVIVAGVLRAHVALGHAGVVHQDVDAAVVLRHPRRQGIDGRRLGDVEGDAGDVEPLGGQGLGRALGTLRYQLGDEDLRAGFAQRLGAGGADALPAPGDDGHAAVQLQLLEIHVTQALQLNQLPPSTL